MRKNISQEIYAFLLAEIQGHRLLPGGALPSESTLCREFYVSRPTVRKAIARLCDEGYARSRPGIGVYVSSGQDTPPSPPPNGRLVIGIDGIDFHDEYQYYGPIGTGARKAAAEGGALLCLTDLPELLNSPEKKVDAFLAARVDGDDIARALQLRERGIPVVLVNRFPPQPELDYIAVDFQYETFQVVNRLIRNGARRIALIGRQTGNQTSAGRTRGWEEAHKANGLEVPHQLAVDFQDFRHDDAILPEFFLKHPLDAVFVALGYQLPPVLNALARLGKRLPEEFDLICFDDIERFAENLSTPISYLKMPLAAMGARAVEHLIRKAANPELPRFAETTHASLVINRSKYLL